MDGCMDVWMSAVPHLHKQVPNRHGNQHRDDMKYTYITVTNLTFSVLWLLAEIKPGIHRFAAQYTTIELIAPPPFVLVALFS